MLPKQTSLQAAINDFHKARQQASLQKLVSRLTGQSVELLSFSEVSGQLKIMGEQDIGLQEIPLKAIVGSVGRYNDFTSTFLPLKESDAQRWANVKSAMLQVDQFPPINVYQIGQAYFVLDGNHRVSIARQQRAKHISAHVIEIETLAPLPEGTDPDQMIIQAEYAQFLADTRLKRLRPEADLQVSIPGQYPHLHNMIDIHRYFLENQEKQPLTDEDAISRWYDEAYLPLVEGIREQGILRYFPGRTETDFYVWLAKNQAEIHDNLGWHFEPAEIVAKLAKRFRPPEKEGLLRRFFKAVLPTSAQTTSPPAKTWSQEKVMARYSSRLFADILVVINESGHNWSPLQQGLLFAEREEAYVHGLTIINQQDHFSAEKAQQLQAKFRSYCQGGRQGDNLAFEGGDFVQRVCRRTVLADLLVFSNTFPNDKRLQPELETLILKSSRPVLVVPGPARPIKRVLLAYDGQDKAREGLFIATYLAEHWGVELAILSALPEEKRNDKGLEYASEYLLMHEVQATFLAGGLPVADSILEQAQEQESDLIIVGSSSETRFGRKGLGETVYALLRDSQRPLLVAP